MKSNRVYLIILIFGLVLFFFITFFGKSTNKQSIATNIVDDNEFILFAKAGVDVQSKEIINKLEDSLSKTLEGNQKIEILDKLLQQWMLEKNFGAAAIYAEKKANLSPNDTTWSDAGINYARALYYHQDERFKNFLFQKAEYAFNQAISLDSNDIQAQQNIATIYIDHSKEPMKGILKLRDLAEQNPTNMDIQFRLVSLSIERTKDYPKAIDRLNKILAIDPNNKKAKELLQFCNDQLAKKNISN